MKVERYKCENCGAVNSHKDSYNDKYCYDCIDIETGELKKKDIKVDWECDNNACNFYKGGNVAPFGKQGICHKCARKITGERI